MANGKGRPSNRGRYLKKIARALLKATEHERDMISALRCSDNPHRDEAIRAVKNVQLIKSNSATNALLKQASRH